MLKLFYSGAKDYNAIQQNPARSLGGFISSTVVPNDVLGNLFGSVSAKGQLDESSEMLAIFVQNISSTPLLNVSLWADVSVDASCKFEFSAVASNNQKSIEQIPSSSGSPYYADFFEANGVENSEVLIASLAAGAIFGLWIKRTILPKVNIPEDDTLIDAWYQQIKQEVEQVNINLTWS